MTVGLWVKVPLLEWAFVCVNVVRCKQWHCDGMTSRLPNI